MDDVDCDAGEERLEDCSFRGWGVNNCNHRDDVGVVCQPGEILNIQNPTHVCSDCCNTHIQY